jgi:predicted MFS family arabinose efflux permease
VGSITAVTSFARRAAPPEAWTQAIAALTVAFGIGQCVGPILSGYLSDGAEGVRAGLQVSAAVLLASALVIAFQRER